MLHVPTQEEQLQSAIGRLQEFLAAEVDTRFFEYYGVRVLKDGIGVVASLGVCGLAENYPLMPDQLVRACESEADWNRLSGRLREWIVEVSNSYVVVGTSNVHELVDAIHRLKRQKGLDHCAIEVLTGEECLTPVETKGRYYCQVHSERERHRLGVKTGA